MLPTIAMDILSEASTVSLYLVIGFLIGFFVARSERKKEVKHLEYRLGETKAERNHLFDLMDIAEAHLAELEGKTEDEVRRELIAERDGLPKNQWEKPLQVETDEAGEETELDIRGTEAEGTLGEKSGDSIAEAVIIDANNTHERIGEEYEYIERKFGKCGEDWQCRSQSVIPKDGRVYDRISLRFPDGGRKRIYFDITSYFGKL